RLAQTLFECLKLRLHRATGISGQKASNPLGRSVCAMGSRERVVDINVAVGSKRLGELGIVLFLTLVEARVFQKQDAAIFKCVDCRRSLLANAVLSKGNGLTKDLRRRIHDLAQ